ncbi:MAG TPA: ABC transporter substrate-binding protein [Pseudolabrys sp.]|nr:ABC transporter substrate-binding protein [Pseudolabrys sp.]
MKRRDFITLLGAAAAWPFAARAQQPALPVIGYLNAGTPAPTGFPVAAFRRGLSEAGFDEGRNVAIEYRWAEGHYDRLPALAADLVRRRVAVIAATGSPAAGSATKAATTSIPIVFSSGSDPVKLGLVSSLSRPEGNLTGVNLYSAELITKQLDLLHELLPQAGNVAVLVNPAAPYVVQEAEDARAAVRAHGQQLEIMQASTPRDIDASFAAIAQQKINAVLIATDLLFTQNSDRIVALAARHAVPVMHYLREYAAAGGLMSYGTSFSEGYRQVGVYTGRILKGAKPGDLPVVQPTKFDLVINLKTAKTLGLTIPPMLLARADEVIE